MKASTLGALSLSVAAAATTFFYSMNASAEEYVDGQTVTVEPFESFGLTSGDVTIRYGNSYTVKIIEGAETLKLEQRSGSLKVTCNRKPCPRGARHVVEVTTDRLEDIAIAGGGRIAISGNFPEVDNLDVAIVGGGEIDARAVPGRHVDVAITGGGDIAVSASETLDAAIIGGGEITYVGNPKVDKSIIGGGAIRQD